MSTIIRNCGAGVPEDDYNTYNMGKMTCTRTGYVHYYAGGGKSNVPTTYTFTRAGFVVLCNIGAQYYGGSISGGTSKANTNIPTGTGGGGGGSKVYYFAPGQTATISETNPYAFVYQIFEVAAP